MEIFETEVVGIIRRTHNVKSFRFKQTREVDFKPGQFFFVTIKINGKERTKHFSFSNSPTEKGYYEFTKRLTGSEFSNALDNLSVGDWTKLKMPYGDFTLDYLKGLNLRNKKIVFLSGGIGITPIRSMCKYIVEKDISIDVKLLYGNRTENDIIFKNDFDNISSKNENINIIYTLDSPKNPSQWRGKRGFITSEMIREEVSDYEDRVFYVCGPPVMVKSLTETLGKELKIPEEKIKLEGFTGY